MIAAPAFAPFTPVLFRRTWLAQHLRRSAGALTFSTLLKKVSPTAWDKLPAVDRTTLGYYQALINALSKLFPVFEIDIDEIILNEEFPGSSGFVALDYGIPFELFGVDHEMVYAGSIPATVALGIYYLSDSIYPPDGDLPELLAPYQAMLSELSGQKIASHSRYALPPRGRQWCKPWQAIGHFGDYCTSSTGSAFLDYGESELAEMGYPRWNIEEIRAIARDWKVAEPIWHDIQALITHIEADLPHRLKQLLKLLVCDENTRLALSQPAKPGKTLAQLFTEK